MKHWTLGARVTAWSALIVGLSTLLFAAGMTFFLHHEQIKALDDSLRNEAGLLLSEWQIDGAEEAWRQQLFASTLRSHRQGPRFIEMIDAGGRSLHRSENLGTFHLARDAKGLRTAAIGSTSVRIGAFQENGCTVILAGSLAEVHQTTWRLILASCAALPLLVGTTFLGGWMIARKAIAPVRAIAAATEAITADQLHRRLPEPPVRDEIGRLTSVLNAMLDRLEKSFQQAVRFSADASHELKTPLTVLRVSIEDLLESPELSARDQEAVAALLEQTQRLSAITKSLLLLSRADAGRLKLDLAPADLTEIISACVEDARIIAQRHAVRIDADLPPTVPIRADSGRLSQIIVNVLDNAVKYNVAGGQVKVTAERNDHEVQVTIGNTGVAIAPEHTAHIFERFFRSDAASTITGYGLGLSLARELARAHGGDLELTGSAAGWTEFRLSLPVPKATARDAWSSAVS